MLLIVDWGGAVVCGSVSGDWKVLGLGGGCIVDDGSVGGAFVVDGGLVGGDWKVLGGSVVGCVVDGWVDLGLGGGCIVWNEFLCWVCLGFGMSFHVGGVGFSLW